MRRRALMNSGEVSTNKYANYMTIRALEDDLVVIVPDSMEYCIHSVGIWVAIASKGFTPQIDAYDAISFRANNSSYDTCFIVNKNFNLDGNCMSLLYGDNADGQTSVGEAAFAQLFMEQPVIEVADNFLPATTVGDDAYFNMYSGCSLLIKGPQLPATALGTNCYRSMFYACTSLKSSAELPATSLPLYCYKFMYFNCTSLTEAKAMSAISMASQCCESMFHGCTSLAKAAPMPNVQTISTYSCYRMYKGCVKLVSAPTLPAAILANYCYAQMFYDCTSLTTGPVLPATSLATYCYQEMFYNCTKLNYIKAMFTTSPGSSFTSNWVYNVASTGTFVKNKNATWSLTGSTGIPSGWTVKTA